MAWIGGIELYQVQGNNQAEKMNVTQYYGASTSQEGSLGLPFPPQFICTYGGGGKAGYCGGGGTIIWAAGAQGAKLMIRQRRGAKEVQQRWLSQLDFLP